MHKIIEYRTAARQSIKELDAKVTELLAEGFQLYGNAYVSEGEIPGYVGPFLACQAMVKYSS
jgi:Domain of unknown function (DUF1737)